MGQKKSSTVVYRDDMVFTGYSSNDHSIPLDAATAFGGHNAGASPMELMLTALGGCTGMDVVSILRKKKQDFTNLEIHVSGIRGDEHPKVYTEITVHFKITGRGIKESAVTRAIELSRDTYCAAAATLRHTAEITYTHEIIEDPTPAGE